MLQQAKLADRRRVVTAIVEVTGLESGRIQLQQLFRFDRELGFVRCGVFFQIHRTFARNTDSVGICQFVWADKGVEPYGKGSGISVDTLAQGGIL